MVSTGRHHGFESLEEQRLLLCLDFAGEVQNVLAQPFRMRFYTSAGQAYKHIPDYLVSLPDGDWLIDVRPRHLMDPASLRAFAAAQAVATSAGWRYSVVCGWRPHVLSAVETMASHRRPMADPLGVQREMLMALGTGPKTFRDLVEGASVPVVARAHALHLLWHRQIGVDLARPLRDDSIVRLAMGRAA